MSPRLIPDDQSQSATDPGGHTSLPYVPAPRPPHDPYPDEAPEKAHHPWKRRARHPVWRWLGRIALVGVALMGLGLGVAVGVFRYYGQNLPNFDTLEDYAPPQTTRLYGSDGSVVGAIFTERRTVVPYGQIPPFMIQALMSAEDARFFEHAGVDYPGTFKAFLRDLVPGRHLAGGSTLTQQLVKTMLLTPDRNFTRKIKEMILALRLEQNLTKEEILHIYLNQINFGHGRYGIEEASLFYFGHGVKELTLGEAALLAAVPKWPNEINPRTNPARAKERQAYVLRRMVENHYISKAVAEREIAKPLTVPPDPPAALGASYIEEVRRQLSQTLGMDAVSQGGLHIDLMMNPVLQAAAENAVRQGLRDLDKRQGWRGPLSHLGDEEWSRLEASVRERLRKATAGGHPTWGESPVLDLRDVDIDSLDHDDEAIESMGAATWRRRQPDTVVVAHVGEVTKTSAAIDFGTTSETLTLASVSWARPFNPTAGTPAPKTMSDVVKPGDLVRIRILRNLPCEAAPCEHLSEIALEQEPLVQGAFVAIDPLTRGVVALVGGYDFSAGASAFNHATQARRQPGSAFKPFVYATALEVGQARALQLRTTPRDLIRSNCLVFQPRVQVNDAPVVIYDHWTGKPWTPHNFEKDSFDGAMTLRHALAVSKNTVAVKLIEQIGCQETDTLSFEEAQTAGLAEVKDTAHRAGIDSAIPDSITAALGSGEVTPLELVNAYTTIAAAGRYAAPILIRKVVSPDGRVLLENVMTGEQPPPLIPDRPPDAPTRGLRRDVAYVTADMMRSVVEDPDGTAHSLQKLGRPIAGKTGTASDERDAWFIGFTPEIVAGAWVGFDDHAMLGRHETGGHAAGPIWLNFMTVAEDVLPHSEFTPPPGVVTVDIDPRTGLLADPHSPYLERETYLAGTEPTIASPPAQVDPPDFWRDGP